jgi:hypothetical protein
MLRSAFALGCLGLLFALPASANERRFAYTYESLALSQGAKEVELWVSPRIGRADYFVRFDNRVELEVGLTDRLVTSVYLNFSMGQETVARTDSLTGSVSSEWKYKLLDPVADPVGLALYAEASFATSEVGLEGKLIVDKRAGNLLVALNAAAEPVWMFEDGKTTHAFEFSQSVGASYLLTPQLAFGLEVFDKMLLADGKLRAGIYVGPVVSYSSESVWVAFSFTPQVASIKPSYAADRAERVDLIENERFTGRLLVGFHI